MATDVAVFAYGALAAPGRAFDAFVDRYALIPYDLTHGVNLAPPAPPAWLTLLTAQFLHASVPHLLANVVVLAIFGPAVESLCGSLRYVAFYLACGVAGGLVQVAADPGSHVPCIGASGAIAGVLGAYLVRFPRVPAALLVGLWALVQFRHGAASFGTRGGVAYFAHIGGFVCGLGTIGLFERARRGQGTRARSAD